MDEQKKSAVIAAAKVIRDFCDPTGDCAQCALFKIGCTSYNLPCEWRFPSDPPPLSPCPFCGGKARSYRNLFHGVGCPSCGARIECYEYLSEKDAILDAVERWNRRNN